MRYLRPLRPSPTAVLPVAIAAALVLSSGAAADKDEPLRNCSLTDDSGRYEVKVKLDGDTEQDVQKDALLSVLFVGEDDFLDGIDWLGAFEGALVDGVMSRRSTGGRKLDMTPGPSASNAIVQDVLLRADALLDCADVDQIAPFDEKMDGRFRKREIDELKEMTWEVDFVAFGSPVSGGGCGNPSGNLVEVDGSAKIEMKSVELRRALPDCGPGDAPGNDNFVDAEDITGETDAVPASTFCATKEDGERKHAGAVARKSIWYRWTTPEDARAKVLTVDNEFDTVVGVYQGDSVEALEKVVANDDIEDDENGESKAAFDAVAGEVYYIAVDGFGEACPASREGAVSVLVKTTIKAEEPEEPGELEEPAEP